MLGHQRLISDFKDMNPKQLFSSDILNYQVQTTKLGQTNYVNLDNAATTPPLAVVEAAVADYLKGYGSVHRGAGTKSQISTTVYEVSRETIKQFVNAPSDAYVLFTGNTTGATNTLAYFFAFLRGKVAVSIIEHSASWLPWIKAEGVKALGRKQVCMNDLEAVNIKIQNAGRVQVLQYDINNQFEFDLTKLETLLQKNYVKALVVTASSNITGYCPDLKKIGALAHKYGAYFIVDGCQYIQHHELDIQALGVDFLLGSGHKFYAPYGGGFVIGPKKFFDQFLPYQIGGGNLPYITEGGEFLRYTNQLAHDPGTPNAVGAVAMASALAKLREIGLQNVEIYEKKLTQRAYDYMRSNPRITMHVPVNHLSTVISFSVKDASSVKVAERLNTEFGIGVRAGSFCAYRAVRRLLGVRDDDKIAAAVRNGDTSLIPKVIRASFGLCNSEADVDRLITALTEITK